jgi:serine/threonine protein kinase
MSTDADFEWLDVCGRGAYGEVHRVKDKRSREIVAIKLIPRPAVDRFVIEEVQNLSKCNHPQIIKFKEVTPSLPPSIIKEVIPSIPITQNDGTPLVPSKIFLSNPAVCDSNSTIRIPQLPCDSPPGP